MGGERQRLRCSLLWHEEGAIACKADKAAGLPKRGAR
jgi:hypothetical protein